MKRCVYLQHWSSTQWQCSLAAAWEPGVYQWRVLAVEAMRLKSTIHDLREKESHDFARSSRIGGAQGAALCGED